MTAIRFRIVDRSQGATWCRDSSGPSVYVPTPTLAQQPATAVRDTSEGAQDLGYFTGGFDGR